MACDSLYCAWLKVYYPYELYVTMLKLYDEKKNTEKISSIISEMKKYKNISLTAGKFGQDNRDWLVDKERQSISQSLSSIRYMSKQAARDLYKLGQEKEAYIGTEVIQGKLTPDAKKKQTAINKEIKRQTVIYEQEDSDVISEEEWSQKQKERREAFEKIENLMRERDALLSQPESWETKPETVRRTAPLNCFTNVLRAIQMNTCLDTRQIQILIELDYFEQFGKSGKLLAVFNEFFEGENSLSKSIKSFAARLKACEQYEEGLPDSALPIHVRLASQLGNIGLCLSIDPDAKPGLYFAKEIDSKYGIKAVMYSVKRGTSGTVRFRKDDFAKSPFEAGDCIEVIEFNKSPKYTFKNGERSIVPGEMDIWVKKYIVIKAPNGNKQEK